MLHFLSDGLKKAESLACHMWLHPDVAMFPLRVATPSKSLCGPYAVAFLNAVFLWVAPRVILALKHQLQASGSRSQKPDKKSRQGFRHTTSGGNPTGSGSKELL